MTGVKAGNAVLDGEVIGKGWRMALFMNGHDLSVNEHPIRWIPRVNQKEAKVEHVRNERQQAFI
jgi:hypothetical protein